MDNKELNKISHEPNNKSLESLNSETSSTASQSNGESLKPRCPLMAKDSEWVDIIQTATNTKSIKNNDQEEVVQLVECDDGPLVKPLALMFPGLLEKDPEMIEGILNKVMSTTEVTKHLVGQRANFACMKKVNRLIPPDKKWLESVTENSTSCCSMESKLLGSSDSEVDAAEVNLDT